MPRTLLTDNHLWLILGGTNNYLKSNAIFANDPYGFINKKIINIYL